MFAVEAVFAAVDFGLLNRRSRPIETYLILLTVPVACAEMRLGELRAVESPFCLLQVLRK